MRRCWLLLGCLALAGPACERRTPPDDEPLFASLEDQDQAHPRTSPQASASASDSPAVARLAAPFEVRALPAPCDVSDRIEALVAGDEALISPIRVNFVLAEVVGPPDRGHVKVRSRHGNEFEAPAAQVYALRPGHQTQARAGCYGACKPGSGWVPCLVTEVEGRRIVAQDRKGEGLVLGIGAVVAFDPEIQERVRAFLVEAQYERAFHEAARRAGRPLQPQGFACARGEVVLAEFGDKHLLAQVTSSHPQRCGLRWLSSSMAPSERPLAEIVPLPTSQRTLRRLDPGDFVLAPARSPLSRTSLALLPGTEDVRAKLPTELAGEWEVMRVEAVYLDGRLLLSDAKQKRHDATSHDVVALRRVGPAGAKGPKR